MSVDFSVDIKIEGSTSEQVVRRFTSELERNERAAKAAKEQVKQWADEGKIGADKQGEAVKRLTRELVASEKAAEAAERASTGLAGALNRIAGTNLGSLANQISSIAGSLGEFGLAGQAIGGFASSIGSVVSAGLDWYDSQLRINDGLIMMRNQLRGVTDDVGGLMEKTHALADRTMTDWNTTVDVYGRVARSLNGLGKSETETLRITETLQKSFATSGRSAQETSAAMLQLSQALGSGVLQGDEFRSISENAPQLLKVFADQLGVTRAELKKMGSEGKITTDIMIKGLEGMADSADRAFAQMEKTQAMKDAPLRNLLAANPGMVNQAVTLGDLSSTKALIEQAFESGRLPGQGTLLDQLGLDDPSTYKVSEFNVQLGKLVDSVNAYKGAIDGIAADADNTPWASTKASTTFAFTGQLISDLEQLGIKAPDAMGELDKSLKLLGAGEDVVKTLGSTFVDLGGQIHGAALEADFLVSKLTGSNALGAVSVGLKKLVDDFAENGKAYKAWDDALERGTQTIAAHHKKITDPWSSTYISPTLAGIDSMIERLKQLAAAEKDVADAAEAAQSRGLAWDLDVQAARDAKQRRIDLYTFDQNVRHGQGAGGYGRGEGTAIGASGTVDQEKAALLTKRWTEELEKNKQKWADVDHFGTQALGHVEDSLVRLAMTGQTSFKQMVNSILADLTRLMIHRALLDLLGGGSAGLVRDRVQSDSTLTPEQSYGGAHAYGGLWTAPNTGGAPDSILASFRVSPGETAMFIPRGMTMPQALQQMPVPLLQSPSMSYVGGDSAAAATPVVNHTTHVSVHQDPRDLLEMLGSPEGEEKIVRVMMKHRGRFR